MSVMGVIVFVYAPYETCSKAQLLGTLGRYVFFFFWNWCICFGIYVVSVYELAPACRGRNILCVVVCAWFFCVTCVVSCVKLGLLTDARMWIRTHVHCTYVGMCVCVCVCACVCASDMHAENEQGEGIQ